MAQSWDGLGIHLTGWSKPRSERVNERCYATFRSVLGFSKDLSRSDRCFDPWINFPASAIKRTVFVFSSSILRRNNEDSSSILRRNSKDSSSCCDLAMPCMLLSSKGWASHAELSDCTKDRRPERGTAEGCVKGLL